MSSDPAFHCPVCRAKQALAETCRRCKADLRLVVRARRRVDYLRAQLEQAIAHGDAQQAATISAELRWLAP